MYLFMRFVVGSTHGGAAPTLNVLSNEMVSSKHRGIVVAMYSSGWALGNVFSVAICHY